MNSSPSSPTANGYISFETVRNWKTEHVNIWLQENNFPEYQQLFAENDINGDVLLELDYNELKEMNIDSIGDRVRILSAVRNLLKICAESNHPYYMSINYSKELYSPELDRFPMTLSRSDSNSQRVTRINSINKGSNGRPKSPQHVKHCIKVIGENQTRNITIDDVSDAESILARVLQKFNINEDVERYSLFTTSETGTARSLSDDELVEICKSADRPERDRLILRKKHQPISHEEIKKRNRDKKLANFFGEKPPSTSQAPQVGISQKKLRNFFGQRPPSELISSNLTEYFPGHVSEELERSARNSIRRASRISAASRYSKTRSKRISRLYDDDDGGNSRLNTLLAPPTDDSKSAILEEEAEETDEFDEFDGFEEVEEDWSPTQEDESSSLKWIKGSLIGMGSFGSVYLGLNAITGELMAVKQVELPTGQSAHEERKISMLDALQREISLLKDLHHENIVQYLGSQHDEKTLNIFLEYVPGGSVATMLNTYGPLEETLIRSFVRQILQGLTYLHDKEIVHRDIKGANILAAMFPVSKLTEFHFQNLHKVDNKGGIKISDFGISKRVEDQFRAAQRPSLQGSVFWMAPEVVKQTAYTYKADIWSLGCLIVEMYTGEHPFPEFNQMQAMFKIGTQSCSPEIPDGVSNEAKDFLKKTFELNHDDRPTAKVLSAHPFASSTSVKSSSVSSP
ncbi:8041_t:CDS:10 [Acaulospora morrowiae]|uniref:8041_t:CDS:1 n=1 Tax=Acaulospora morrowiae TaxID=94023 RepID=A0A9N8WJY9_9GLOM|nr:8041_t:CDS:10 [Acaulospora morrowiae]